MGTVKRSLSSLRVLRAHAKGKRLPQPPDQEIDFSDAPDLTDTQLSQMRRLHGGRPPIGRAPRPAISLRVDPDVLEVFRRTGKGWQSRMSDALRRASRRLGHDAHERHAHCTSSSTQDIQHRQAGKSRREIGPDHIQRFRSKTPVRRLRAARARS